MRKTYFLIVIIVVLSMISTACNSEIFQIANQEIDIENQEEIVEVGRNKDTNLILSVTRFKTLNPLLNNNRSLVQVHKLIYESLVSFDEEMKVVPQLAQKWEVSEDGRTIDFTIRQNVYWHDGKEFSIDDIIFTFDVIKKAYKDRKTHSPYEDIADLILSKVDDNTVRFYFERPIGTALDLLVFPILPSHLFLEGNLDKLYSNDFPLVGTGRYKIKEYLRMRQLTLIKNDRYWGKQASIEKIEVVVVPDLNAQISLLDSGEINFVQVVDTDWRRYYDHDSLRVYEFITNNLEFIGFNFKNETLNNLKVRKAIAYAIDRHRLVSNIYLGHATIVDVPVNPNSWLYYEGEYLFSHNIENAKILLDEAGYRINKDKMIRENADGEELIFRLITNEGNSMREKTAYFIKEMLEEIGIKLEIEILEWEEFNEAVEISDFDIVLAGWHLSKIHDLSFAFHSTEIGNTNIINYQNEELDVKLESVTNSIGREEFSENSKLVQRYISDNLLYYCLFFEHQAIVMDRRVEGLVNPQFHNIFYEIEEWYFDVD